MADIWLQFILTIDATCRLSAPLILCAMAGLFSERSGIIDISLEGKMLMAAFVAATIASLTGSAWMALISAVCVSVGLSLIHGFACITHKGNQVVSGLAINILASGLSVTLAIAIFAQGGLTPLLSKSERFLSIIFPFAHDIGSFFGLGTIYRELLSGHNFLVWLAFFSVFVTSFILFQTSFGLRLRAVGENPEAVDTAGISVSSTRYQAVIITGILCGLAGTYLSVAHGAGFVREMTAGKGYIALAALIFGNWRPLPVLLACCMFGFLDAVATRLQGVDIFGLGQIPTDLILVLPYLLTVIVLAGFIGTSRPPQALGVPYVKER